VVLGRVFRVLTVASPSAVPGGEVRISGEGCEPGEAVEVLLDGTRFATREAGADGSFDLALALPLDAAIGEHELEARCGDLAFTNRVDVVVASSAGAASSSAGVVLAFFLLLALIFTQGRGAVVRQTAAPRGSQET
jgi:hypothetical protein